MSKLFLTKISYFFTFQFCLSKSSRNLKTQQVSEEVAEGMDGPTDCHKGRSQILGPKWAHATGLMEPEC